MDGFVAVPIGPRTPGVYVLLRAGRPVFAGRSKNLLARLYAHAQHHHGRPLQAGMPARPVIYDEVRVRPTTLEAMDAELAATRSALGLPA